MTTNVRATWQFCQGGWDITRNFVPERDADLVRVWDGDSCVMEVSRPKIGKWAITGSDGHIKSSWYDMRFDSPEGALEFLAGKWDQRYAFTDEEWEELTGPTKDQAEAVVARIAEVFGADPKYGPELLEDWDGHRWVVMWEKGPFEWTYGASSKVDVPGVWVEAINHYSVAIHRVDQ